MENVNNEVPLPRPELVKKKGTSAKRFSLSEFGRKAKNRAEGVRSNPIVPGAADYIQGQLWDRTTSAAATTLATEIRMFTQPQGTAGKTKNDTNMTNAGQLPAPQWINVISLQFYFSTLMQKVDLDGFWNTYWAEFWVQDKIYAEGHYFLYPAPGGMAGNQSFAAGTLSTFYTNGVPNTSNFYDLRLPSGIDLGGVVTDGATGIIINSGQNFFVSLKTGTSGLTLAAASGAYGGFNMLCYLAGIISRQVQ